MPKGVTYKPDSAEVFIDKDGTFTATNDYTVDDNPGPPQTLTLTIGSAAYKDINAVNYANKQIKITYQAVLNKDAVIEDIGNTNTAVLTYTSNINTLGVAETATTEDSAIVYTLELDITKVEKNNISNTLKGAEFEVYKTSNGTGDPIKFIEKVDTVNEYRVATQAEITDGATTVTTIKVADNGKLNIYGLDKTKYYFKETKAPTGYNIPNKLFEINVQPNADNDYNANGLLAFDGNPQAENIENASGIDLPVTGGMGTIIFTAIGLLLMAGAAYILFSGKKKSVK